MRRLYFLFQISVTPQSDWPVPSGHNNSCLNVVKKVSAWSFAQCFFLPLKNECVKPFPFVLPCIQVEFIIGYTGRGELTYANVNIILADVAPDQLLLQTHSVQYQVSCHTQFSSSKWWPLSNTGIDFVFQLEADAPPPERPNSAVGLRIGSPVMTLFDGKVLPVSSETTQAV